MKIEIKIPKSEIVAMVKSHSRSIPLKSTKTIIDKKTKRRNDRKAWRKEL